MDKAPPSPYLSIHSDGLVRVQNEQMLVSTCRMRIHKFPFDVQICNLSFKSVVHSGQSANLQGVHISDINMWPKQDSHPLLFPLITVSEIQLVDSPGSSGTSDMTMRSQYEWLFVSMTVTNKTVNMFNLKQDVLIYTVSMHEDSPAPGANSFSNTLVQPACGIGQITMKRQSLLYIVNFLLPILFLLSLDIASFFISKREGEKLGFKVTVLLAVTVMQLLLNEILPSSSDQIPLIGRAADCRWNQVLKLAVFDWNAYVTPPFSRLLHWDFWFDDAEPPGDHFGDVPDGERQSVT